MSLYAGKMKPPLDRAIPQWSRDEVRGVLEVAAERVLPVFSGKTRRDEACGRHTTGGPQQPPDAQCDCSIPLIFSDGG